MTSAVFDAAARQIMDVLRLLDGLRIVRFQDQPKLQAEWEAAKSVFGSARARFASGWRHFALSRANCR